MRAKNISARQFAEEIGIQPSGMSHILGGRNHPSLEFVQKVIRRYPEIDANWLLMGRGEMYFAAPSSEGVGHEAVGQAEPSASLLSAAEGVEDRSVVPLLSHQENFPEAEEWPYGGEVGADEGEADGGDEAEWTDEGEVAPMEEETRVASPSAVQHEEKRLEVRRREERDGGEEAMVQLLMVYADHTFEVLTPRGGKR